MPTQATPFTIIFPEWYDARCEQETPIKGYLSDVEVRLEDGSRYKLYFTDPIRLQQTLEDDAASGRAYYAEPGLIVLPEVTTEAIRQAVSGLEREGYFRHLKPLACGSPLTPIRASTMKFHDCDKDTLRQRLRRYGCQCRWCGNRLGRDFHHIQPREAGGSDEWANLIWVCEVCHTLLDEFCRKYWNDPDQSERMREIRSCSIEAEFQQVDGAINKRKSREQWNYAGIFEMGKEGKVAEPPRTADDIWHDLAELKKYMKVDRFLCIDYLTKFAVHQNQPVFGFARGGPVLIAAPSLEALLEKARELQIQEQGDVKQLTPEETKEKYEQGKQAAIEDYQKYKEMEDEFFHKVFRPS